MMEAGREFCRIIYIIMKIHESLNSNLVCFTGYHTSVCGIYASFTMSQNCSGAGKKVNSEDRKRLGLRDSILIFKIISNSHIKY